MKKLDTHIITQANQQDRAPGFVGIQFSTLSNAPADPVIPDKILWVSKLFHSGKNFVGVQIISVVGVQIISKLLQSLRSCSNP